MRSRSTRARTSSRAAIALCLVIALSATTVLISGCSLLGLGEEPPAETQAPPSAEATGTAGSEDTETPAPEEAVEPDDEAVEEAEEELAASVEATYTEVTEARVSDLRRDGARVISVDTRQVYEDEHIKGASNVPLRLLEDEIDEWDADDPIVLVSRTEAKSRSGAGYLVRNGFTDVYYLGDGYDGWDGSFQGDDARTRTIPARIYYIYSSDPRDILPGAAPIDPAELKKLTDDMEVLTDEWDDVTVELVDGREEYARFVELVEDYDVPTLRIGFVDYVVVPHWIMVDYNGKVTQVNLLPTTAGLPRVFGFGVQQQEIIAAR